MPATIRVLDDATINKIAAGEVIENPASVVKELVENSIDAGAGEICVEIQGGGRQLIRCTDNGCGMGRDDAVLCFERNATSKIRNIQEIHGLTTMGFRGEAIPSIAAISKLTLLTRRREDDEGALVISEGSRIVECSGAARSPGTTVEVKSLFFNVPVRKKFQRSPAYDTNEILKVVTIQALAHPDIKFRLITNQKNTLSTKLSQGEEGITRIGSRISSVLGSEFYANLCPIESEYRGYRLLGYCGKPAYTRHNRTGQYLFINQRAVHSSPVSYAVKEGYGPTLEPNRHPVFVLYLTMDGMLVDVNVHPQKREVRLRQEYQLREMIVNAVEGAFQDFGPTPFLPDFSISYDFSSPPKNPILPDWEEPSQSAALVINEPKAPPLSFFSKEEELPISHTWDKICPKVVATLPGYLILTSEKEQLLAMDQQAAHSRILYENTESPDLVPMQQLLVPLTVELSSIDAQILKESMEQVNLLGLKMQEFGQNSFIVNSIPQFFKNTDIEAILLEIVREIRHYGQTNVVRRELQKTLSQAAARAALPKNKILDALEGQSLYEQLMQCRSPFLCPRGRPTLLELTEETFAKLFEKQ